MDKKINICIIHYNTPFLTECLIKSINKFTPGCNIYIFDNSDNSPFISRFDNVIVFDNTNKQYIDFDEFLSKYPNSKYSGARMNNYGSAKHCYSVQKCIELIDDNFILMDSDILLKKDISDIIKDSDDYCVTGMVEDQFGFLVRVIPYLCYLNVKKMKEMGITYFNENFMHGLNVTKEGDVYDTGAWLYKELHDLDECGLNNININDYICHYSGGSWKEARNKVKVPNSQITRRGTKTEPPEWLYNNYSLWGDVDKKDNLKLFGVTLVYNESEMIPYVMPYYERMGFDRLIVYDNNSTDNTVELLKKYPFVEIRHFSTEGLDDFKQSEIKNKACSEFQYVKKAWMYVSDFDEVLYYDGNFKEYLSSLAKDKYTHLNQQIFQPISYRFPNISDGSLAHEGMNKGFFWMTGFGKKMTLFNLEWARNVQYDVGAHRVHLFKTSNEKTLNGLKIRSLHLKYIDYNYLLAKTKRAADRLSERNKNCKLGFQYDFYKNDNTFERHWNEIVKKTIDTADYINGKEDGDDETVTIFFDSIFNSSNAQRMLHSKKRIADVKRESNVRHKRIIPPRPKR